MAMHVEDEEGCCQPSRQDIPVPYPLTNVEKQVWSGTDHFGGQDVYTHGTAEVDMRAGHPALHLLPYFLYQLVQSSLHGLRVTRSIGMTSTGSRGRRRGIREDGSRVFHELGRQLEMAHGREGKERLLACPA